MDESIEHCLCQKPLLYRPPEAGGVGPISCYKCKKEAITDYCLGCGVWYYGRGLKCSKCKKVPFRGPRKSLELYDFRQNDKRRYAYHSDEICELKLHVENLQEEISHLHKLILNVDQYHHDEAADLREQVEKLRAANQP